MTRPLRDLCGRLRAWWPDCFRPCERGETPVAVVCLNAAGTVLDCRRCESRGPTLILRELVTARWGVYECETDLCGFCGAELTPAVPVTEVPAGAAKDQSTPWGLAGLQVPPRGGRRRPGARHVEPAATLAELLDAAHPPAAL